MGVGAETEPGASSATRDERVRLALVATWLAFGISSTFWLPVYNGTASLEPLALIYVVIAVLAGLAIRQRARDTARAVASAMPIICFVGLAGQAAALNTDANAGDRGEPLYLHVGVTLLASWATLTLATALAARTLWTRLGGLLLTLVVAFVGFWLMTARVD
ncbi:MAG: hypothetical protein EDQ89_10235 [Acidobacteria bacterium]|nr:MAG: hypothetical protein EDQ89_10235 [Acidobacteriota bacterium]MCL4286257.1 hypothetical protein [Thermoleophilia bacterium]GIK76826.1 MAG: hypothetical protein BroJett022_05160 [Actinomycetes bacterium]